MTTKHDKKHRVETEEPAAGTQQPGEGSEDRSAAEAAAKEIEGLKKELLYQAAELENFKRRTEKRYRDALAFASEPLIRDLLSVLDNLERAADHAAEATSAVSEGLSHIASQLREALARQGVEEVRALGEKFDPNFHEALATVPGKEDNIVAAVHEKGYTMQGKLLRPSRVVVSRLATAGGDG